MMHFYDELSKCFKVFRVDLKFSIWGQSYKANFGINNIKNGLNKPNFTLNYINFDVIYAKKVL